MKMKVHYHEIVTDNVDATCKAYAASAGASFGDESVPELGGARLLARPDGTTIGVRGRLSPDEPLLHRPYFLVDDVTAAYDAALAEGGQEVHPPLEIPGRGKFAIYKAGGVHHGLWEL